MRAGGRAERSSRYTPVPQAAISDEDEGVFDESPESSQHAELLPSTERQPVASGDSNDASSGHHDEEEEDYAADSLRPLDLHGALSDERRRLQQHHRHALLNLRHALSPVALSGASFPSSPPPKMSCQRWVCFSVSVGLCMGYILALLWLIPCQWAPCLDRGRRSHLVRLNQWNTTLPHTSFISKPWPVSIGPSDYTLVLLAFYVSDDQSAVTISDRASNTSNGTKSTSGVMALRGDNGRVAWCQSFHTAVVDLACDVVDVNGDGIAECTVMGQQGLMAAVNVSNGYTFWYLHDHDDQSVRITALSTPLPLPGLDLDKDGVSDMAILGLLEPPAAPSSVPPTTTAAAAAKESQRRRRSGGARRRKRNSPDSEDRPLVHLLLISGATGQIIGRALALPMLSVPPSYSPASSASPPVTPAPPASVSELLPAPVLFDLGNRPAALLLLSGGGGTRVSGGTNNMPETILLATLEDVYAEATQEWASGDQLERGRSGASVMPEGTLLKEIYRAQSRIDSLRVVTGGANRAGDVLVLQDGGRRLVCLDGNADFVTRWSFQAPPSYLLSDFVTGRYNDDTMQDVFFLLWPENCTSGDCPTKAMVLDGLNGQQLVGETSERALSPYIPLLLRAEEATNATDVFMFRAVAPTGMASQSTPVMTTTTDVRDAVPYGLAETYATGDERRQEAKVAVAWTDIRNYVADANVPPPPPPNDTTLYRVEQVWGGSEKTSTQASLPSPTSSLPTVARESSRLVAFQMGGPPLPWEVLLARTATCGADRKGSSSEFYTAIPSNAVGNPFLVAAVNCGGDTKSAIVTSVDLGKAIPHTHYKPTETQPYPTVLHPTTD